MSWGKWLTSIWPWLYGVPIMIGFAVLAVIERRNRRKLARQRREEWTRENGSSLMQALVDGGTLYLDEMDFR